MENIAFPSGLSRLISSFQVFFFSFPVPIPDPILSTNLSCALLTSSAGCGRNSSYQLICPIAMKAQSFLQLNIASDMGEFPH